MSRWWNDRSRRERLMLGAMGASVVAFALWYGLYAPTFAARGEAMVRYHSALARQAEVDAAVVRIRILQGQVAVPAPSEPPEAAVAATAAEAGLTIVRTERDPEGGLRIAVDADAATALFPWLGRLQREQGLLARNLTVVKDETGGLRIDATLAGPEG